MIKSKYPKTKTDKLNIRSNVKRYKDENSYLDAPFKLDGGGSRWYSRTFLKFFAFNARKEINILEGEIFELKHRLKNQSEIIEYYQNKEREKV